MLQPHRHLVKLPTDGGELVLPSIVDLTVQIAGADLRHSRGQEVQRPFDLLKYRADQEPVGQQNGQKNGEGQHYSGSRQQHLQGVVRGLSSGAGQIDLIAAPVQFNPAGRQIPRSAGHSPLAAQDLRRPQERIPRLQGSAVLIEWLSPLQHRQGHGTLIQDTSQGLQTPQTLFRPGFQRFSHQHRRAATGPEKVLAVLKSQAAPMDNAVPDQAQTPRGHGPGDAHWKKNHQQIGARQPLFYRHTLSPRAT